MDNNSIQIERYLQNEMSAGEKIEFESRLATDKNLLNEFTAQQQIIRASIHTGIKNEFNKAISKKILTRQLIQVGIVIAITVAFLLYAVKNNWFGHHGGENEINNVTVPERFEINNSSDTIIETRNGVVFAIPANAFNSSSNTIQLEIKTALDANAIMQNGLSSISNGAMLQTAGMFYFNGLADGKQVPLVKDIAVSVPAKEVNPAMQLFDGVEGKDGNINWVNPKPIEKKLRTYDITTLDFYPPDYLPTLKALQKNYGDKKYTDSLYYSFSDYAPAMPGKDILNKKIDTILEDALGMKDTSIIIRQDSLGKRTDESFQYIHYELDPGRIRTIWDKKFNNTIIATKEFEERLKYIHGLCSSRYLDAYLDGLNKPLYEIDKVIADNSSGEIKKKFLEFAARKDGAVIIAEGMQQKLSIYFQQKYQAYKEAEIKTRAKYEAELTRLNNIADAKRREEELKEFSRKSKNFEDEFCINLTESYKQIGIKRNCNDTIIPPTGQYYNITISTTGWKNLDVYVFDATQDRQNMTYTDPITGKTATLIYREVTIQIENQSEYDRVLVYLIPDSLNSFQRMQQQDNVFKEKINSIFRYDAVALAYIGTKAYYYRQQSLKSDAYMFNLSPLSNEELRSMLKVYSFTKTTALRTGFEYQLFEQQELIRVVKLRKEWEFRKIVASSIFSCMEESSFAPK